MFSTTSAMHSSLLLIAVVYGLPRCPCIYLVSLIWRWNLLGCCYLPQYEEKLACSLIIQLMNDLP